MKLLSRTFNSIISFFSNFTKLNSIFSNCNCNCNNSNTNNKTNIPTINIEDMKKSLAENNYSFEIGYTDASEFKLENICGLKEQKVNKKLVKSEVPIVTALPSKWDWRENNGDTPVKNQGNCGSCWAFATVGPLEANIRIKDNKVVDLSEQFLVSCNKNGWGCNGGFWAHDYHVNPGAVLESDFPYQAKEVACKTTPHPYKIKSYSYVSSSSMPSVDAIKSAIYNYGPVTAGVTADSYFQSYRSGVFDHDTNANINHGIVLVGWDDSLGAWILKNSWGTNWGINGYMYIKYGVCKVGYRAAYVVYEGNTPPPTPTDTNIALNMPVTASGYYRETYLPKNIVDGDPTSSRWVVSSKNKAWITIDLQSEKTINSMKLYWSKENYPKSYTLRYWDGNQWINLKNITSDGSLDTEIFTEPIKTRYISLQLSNPNSSYYTLYEWEVYGK